MDTPFLSVVVPVFNVENYLERCVSSILCQDFTDFELLLIDDGSTDKSGEILNGLAKTDSRVKVFHNENHGLSFTRNFGIDKSSGKYICFIDSDDYIKPGYFKFMCDNIGSADILLCGYISREKDGCETVIFAKERTVTPENLMENLAELKEKYLIDTACNKLYSLDFLRSNRLLFNTGELFEDTEFNLKLLKYGPVIKVFPDCFYVYCQNSGSITKKYNPEKLETLKKRATLLKEIGGELSGYSDYFLIKSVFSAFSDMFFKTSGLKPKQRKDIIRKEIGDSNFKNAAKAKYPGGKSAVITLFFARNSGVGGIYLYSFMIFFLKYKLRKLFLKVRF